jgi:hypothetical protein
LESYLHATLGGLREEIALSRNKARNAARMARRTDFRVNEIRFMLQVQWAGSITG